MKARINYKSRKTIIIIAIAAILLILAIGGTVAFMKGNRETAAAMENKEITAPASEENSNNGAENGQNSENTIENSQSENNQNETSVNNETIENNVNTNNNTITQNNVTTNNTVTAGEQGNNTTATGQTNTTVPNQEYTQTTVQITEQPWEKTKIGWSPIVVSAMTASSKFGIHKANLQNEKLVYVGDDSIELPPVKTVAQKGDMLTYVIKVTNTSDIDANNIKIYDNIPEGTIYAEEAENSISDNGTIENNKISWKINIPKGETKTVFFKVVVTTDTLLVIDNTAKVDGEDTNTVHTPIITKIKDAKIVVTDKNNVEKLEDRDAKVGEKIRYTVTITNKSEYEGYTNVWDIVPEGTTLVKESISNEGKVETIEQDGINIQKIVWDNIKIAAKGNTTVSFDVTVNKEKLNKETNEMELVKNVKNKAVVGENETNEVETKVANIDTIKESIPSNEPLHELDTITYTLTSTNYGEGTGSVSITDEIPEDTTLVSEITDSDNNKYTTKELNEGIVLTLKPNETKAITFTVRINPFEGETKQIDNIVARQDGEEIPGTHDIVEKKYKSVEVEKIFVDKENIDKVRPASIVVGLYIGTNPEDIQENQKPLQTRTLTPENNKATFDNLNKYDLETEELINYTVKEIDVNINYIDSYETVTNGDHTTIKITNTLKYENILIEKEAEKIWDDENSEDRPSSINIAILDGNTKVQEKQVQEDENGNWKVTFTGLNKYRINGEEIEYTFDEIDVPEGYVKTVEGNKIINALPRIEVIKTAVSIDEKPVDENSRLVEGNVVEYEITVKNIGNITLKNVTLTDVLENGKQIFLDPNKQEEKTNIIVSKDDELTLKPTKFKTYTVYYKVEKDDVANLSIKDSLKNTAKAVGYYNTNDGKENYVDDDDPETIKFKEQPNASIVKAQKVDNVNLSADGKELNTQNTPKVLPESVIDYTITIKNTGNKKLTNLLVTDTMKINDLERNVEIQTVTVNGVKRDYTEKDDGSLSISGELQVDDTLVITAKYTVKKEDVSEDINIIENKATFESSETPIQEDEVKVPTTPWVTNIDYGKKGTLKDGSDANTKSVMYGDTITYTLYAKNTGTKAGEKLLQDTDIATMVEKGWITQPSKIIVNNFDENGKAKKTEITTDILKTLTDGIKVNLPADETGNKVASITFTVTVTAPPETTISNAVVGKENEPVVNPVIKELTVTATEYKAKDIVVVLDLSSSMLKVPGTDNYPENCVTRNSNGVVTSINVPLLNKSKETKLYAAKEALKDFINDVLAYNPNNKITLVTFNFDTFEHAKIGLSYSEYSYYWARVKNETAAHPYIKTQELVSATSSKKKLTDAINNIYLTYPLLTNVVSALDKTEEVVEKIEASNKKNKLNRDIEVVFIGDGKPSYSSEACAVGNNNASAGFYDKTTTFNKIEQLADKIKYTDPDTKKQVRSHIYTLEYDVPSTEKQDAKTTFNYLASGSNYKFSATATDLKDKLADIGETILQPETKIYTTTKNNGDIIIEMKEGTTLRVEGTPVTPVTLTIDSGEKEPPVITFNSIADIKGDIIEFKDNKFTVHMDKLPAGAKISLNYYYETK